MNRIGMFFGTETGTTRLVAKKMQKKLGDELCAKPLNVNRITPAEMLAYDALILGTPSYADRFCSSLLPLVEKFKGWGAEVIGEWPADGYVFEQSAALVDGRFLGLIIDQRTQGMYTDERMDAWLAQVVPLLREKLTT